MEKWELPFKKEDAEKYNKFRWWLGITLGDMLDKAADLYPNKEALVDKTGRLTYSQLRDKANRLAISLMDLGIKKQDRILLQIPNWIEFVYAYFAIQKIGAITVLLLPRHAQAEINHLCRLTEATAWIVTEAFQNIKYRPIINDVRKANPELKHIILARRKQNNGFLSLERLIEQVDLNELTLQKLAERRPDPMDVAHMGPTGGTTGLPKVAPRTHNDYICNAEYMGRALEMCSHDITLVVAPVGHNLSGRVGVIPSVLNFGKMVMLDSTRPEDILETIEREKVTMIPWVPAMASSIVNFEGLEDYDVSSLQKMYCSTQASPAKLIKDINEKLGCKCVTAYGATEGYHIVTRLDYDQAVIHSMVGRPTCPYDTYKIIGEDGKELPPNTPGELIVKGPGVFSGYYKAPEENEKTFTKDGFLKTGDQLMVDDNGNYKVIGRIKDMIKRGGESISPTEIEGLIINHPGVVDVSVVSMPDPVLGERACAYIQPRPGIRLYFDEIISFLRDRGASVYQLPERIEFIESMPLTKVGKADKEFLRRDITKKLKDEFYMS